MMIIKIIKRLFLPALASIFFYQAIAQSDALLPSVSPDTSCSSSGVIFCNGFEEGNLSAWAEDSDGNPDSTNHLMADPGPFNITGNHVMRLRVPPGRGGADLTKVLPGTYDKLYARRYEYWEVGYDFKAPNHGVNQTPHPFLWYILQGLLYPK